MSKQQRPAQPGGARGWRALVKPYAVGAISRFWLSWYRLKYGKRVYFGANFITNGKLVVKGPGKVIFGDDVNAWCNAEKNVLITYRPEARIIIGDEVRLNGAGIMAHTTIEIGARSNVGSVIMLDSDFHPLDPRLRRDPSAPFASAPVIVGRNVWVGGQTALLKGVTVGENSVIGFRAVVTNSVPANTVVAGNPARVVKRLD